MPQLQHDYAIARQQERNRLAGLVAVAVGAAQAVHQGIQDGQVVVQAVNELREVVGRRVHDGPREIAPREDVPDRLDTTSPRNTRKKRLRNSLFGSRRRRGPWTVYIGKFGRRPRPYRTGRFSR